MRMCLWSGNFPEPSHLGLGLNHWLAGRCCLAAVVLDCRLASAALSRRLSAASLARRLASASLSIG